MNIKLKIIKKNIIILLAIGKNKDNYQSQNVLSIIIYIYLF